MLTDDAENKDELLIEFVKKIKQRADSYLKKETEKLLISQKKLNDKHRTDQIKQLMSTIDKVDNQERTDLLNIMIEKTKLEEEYLSELDENKRVIQQLGS